MTITSSLPKNLLKQLIHLFPNQLSFAFAYGSGVFKQSVATNEVKTKSNGLPKNMIDLILVVNDSIDFHYHNLIRNRNHYSMLGYLGAKWLASIQDHFGAKVYFNTLVPIDGHIIKYGIINTKNLITDCLDWQTLYISGRLHKPVAILQESNSQELSNALRINTESALHSALLLLSETFTEEQLYSTIAGLSYLGDFRMTFGEDRHKVQNIVRPQMNNFRHLYQPLITGQTLSQMIDWNPNSRVYSQDCSPNAMFFHLNRLPKTVEDLLVEDWREEAKRGEFTDVEDLLTSLSNSVECKTIVKSSIESIVRKSSISQSLKGIISAGIMKSIRYSNQKVIKMFNSFH